jgi:hypothetical protein
VGLKACARPGLSDFSAERRVSHNNSASEQQHRAAVPLIAPPLGS